MYDDGNWEHFVTKNNTITNNSKYYVIVGNCVDVVSRHDTYAEAREALNTANDDGKWESVWLLEPNRSRSGVYFENLEKEEFEAPVEAPVEEDTNNENDNVEEAPVEDAIESPEEDENEDETPNETPNDDVVEDEDPSEEPNEDFVEGPYEPPEDDEDEFKEGKK